jgi:hypothetical protein
VAFLVPEAKIVHHDNDDHQAPPVQRSSTDLTYLHPDNVEIGSTGVFALAAEDQGFAAVIVPDGDDHTVGIDIFLEPRRFDAGDRQALAELFTGREAARRPSQNPVCLADLDRPAVEDARHRRRTPPWLCVRTRGARRRSGTDHHRLELGAGLRTDAQVQPLLA